MSHESDKDQFDDIEYRDITLPWCVSTAILTFYLLTIVYIAMTL